jgi:hypothetical protein
MKVKVTVIPVSMFFFNLVCGFAKFTRFLVQSGADGASGALGTLHRSKSRKICVFKNTVNT